MFFLYSKRALRGGRVANALKDDERKKGSRSDYVLIVPLHKVRTVGAVAPVQPLRK